MLDATLQDKLEWNRPDTDILYRTVSQFRTFRKLVTGDNEKQAILRELLKHDFIGVVLTNAPVILRFVEATDEATRAIITMTRTSDDALTSQVIKRLFENGAVIFVVLAMKAHMLASQSIRVQGLELLTRMLEFVKKEHNRGESKGVTGTGEYPKQESSYVRDAVHQMLLHGAAAILVRLLSYSMDSASETAMRRSIYCMQFLVLETPPQMTLKLATYDNYSSVRSLCKAFVGTKTRTAQLEAASLLTGFLSSSVSVAELITTLGAWDHLSVILATNAESIRMPKEWLVGSLHNIRRLGEDPATREKMERKAAAAERGPRTATCTAEEGSSMTMPVGNSSVEVSVEGSFENILTSMLESAYGSAGKSRRVNKSSSETTFGRNETLNAQYSAAMQMNTSDSMPALHGANTGSKRPKSSGGGSKKKGNGGSGGPRVYGRGSRPSSAAAAGSRPRSAKEAKAAAADFLATAGSRPGSNQQAGGRGLAEESSNYVPGYHGSGVNSNFARRLKKSPLGQPVDPEKIRQMRRSNGGKLPEHIPHALGGPDIGNRPGPDYGSKVKKPAEGGTPASTMQGTTSPFKGQLKQAPSFKLLPTAREEAEAAATWETNCGEGQRETEFALKKSLKKAGSDASRKQQHTRFVAQKLFVSEADRERARTAKRRKGETDSNQALSEEEEEEAEQHKAEKGLSGSAVGKLTFAERLQVMIMQVEGL